MVSREAHDGEERCNEEKQQTNDQQKDQETKTHRWVTYGKEMATENRRKGNTDLNNTGIKLKEVGTIKRKYKQMQITSSFGTGKRCINKYDCLLSELCFFILFWYLEKIKTKNKLTLFMCDN